MLIEDINIEEILPQSTPFIMIDKVTEFKTGESLTAIKNVSANEWFFKGRLHEATYFPETLLIEAAAQTAIIFAKLSNNSDGGNDSLFILGKIKAEFFGQTCISDRLTFRTTRYKFLQTSGFIDIDASIKNNSIAKINIFFSLKR